MSQLAELQKKLQICVINYDLHEMWSSHALIPRLREKVIKYLPSHQLYDPQDLEHQALFRLTTFDPKDINDDRIQSIIDEQHLIVQDRLKKLNFDSESLFRGLTGKYHDLNIKDRLTLCWEDGKLIARNAHRSFNVEFKMLHDDRVISLFSNELHYIHRDRPKGETFGFYFSGEEIPWAIETTEPSAISKQYKRDALLANGLDPNKAIELTRFYTLPGAPLNAISLMDGLVARHYKTKGMEALFTTTMPMYAKTKSTTIAGGINKPLLVKDLRHKFIPTQIQGRTCYRHVTTIPEDHNEIEVITTHPNFPTALVVEVFRLINEPSLKPLPVFQDGKKVMYVIQRERKKVENEIKLPIDDTAVTISRLREVSNYSHTTYMRDVIYGIAGEKKKIRLRMLDNFANVSIEATYKYSLKDDREIKRAIEEILYKGQSLEAALSMIQLQGDFKEENSYEKIRVVFNASQEVLITVDIYPFGSWLEIEGEVDRIKNIAKKLGFNPKDYITLGADDLYLQWSTKHKLPEMWDVRFGLVGKK